MPTIKRTDAEGWNAIQDEEITFTTIGQTVVGTLLGYRQDQNGSRPITIWDVAELSSGEVQQVIGTTMLNRLLNKVKEGMEVRIEYIDELPPSGDYRSGLKLFDVRWRNPHKG